MPKHRVYFFYVGCHVFDVEADTPEQAATKVQDNPEQTGIEFLHEANEPHENEFFIDVYRYEAAVSDEERDTETEPAFTSEPVNAQLWAGWPLERILAATKKQEPADAEISS